MSSNFEAEAGEGDSVSAAGALSASTVPAASASSPSSGEACSGSSSRARPPPSGAIVSGSDFCFGASSSASSMFRVPSVDVRPGTS